MTFKSAQESFEAARQIAEESGDSVLEHIAAGLADLAAAMRKDSRKLDSVESKINQLN